MTYHDARWVGLVDLAGRMNIVMTAVMTACLFNSIFFRYHCIWAGYSKQRHCCHAYLQPVTCQCPYDGCFRSSQVDGWWYKRRRECHKQRVYSDQRGLRHRSSYTSRHFRHLHRCLGKVEWRESGVHVCANCGLQCGGQFLYRYSFHDRHIPWLGLLFILLSCHLIN